MTNGRRGTTDAEARITKLRPLLCGVNQGFEEDFGGGGSLLTPNAKDHGYKGCTGKAKRLYRVTIHGSRDSRRSIATPDLQRQGVGLMYQYFNVTFVADYFSMTVGARANNVDSAIERAIEKIQTRYGWNLKDLMHELQIQTEGIKGLV